MDRREFIRNVVGGVGAMALTPNLAFAKNSKSFLDDVLIRDEGVFENFSLDVIKEALENTVLLRTETYTNLLEFPIKWHGVSFNNGGYYSAINHTISPSFLGNPNGRHIKIKEENINVQKTYVVENILSNEKERVEELIRDKNSDIALFKKISPYLSTKPKRVDLDFSEGKKVLIISSKFTGEKILSSHEISNLVINENKREDIIKGLIQTSNLPESAYRGDIHVTGRIRPMDCGACMINQKGEPMGMVQYQTKEPSDFVGIKPLSHTNPIIIADRRLDILSKQMYAFNN